MRILVCGDLHLKPAASDYDIDGMTVPDEIDAALILGDLTHRAGTDDVELANRFVERFPPTLPVVYIPGNHDHSPMDERVVESVEGAQSGHCTTHDIADVTVVGWGCEERSLSLAIDQCAFKALDPRDVPQGDRRYAADQIADDIEAACHEVICGPSTRADAADSLGISASERAAFDRGMADVEETYNRLADILAETEDILLATHVPPFNTSFDRHHAMGNREEDREFLHIGSIALKLAIREHDVFASLSGHSHTYGYDNGDGEDGRPYYLNLGFRGVGTVSVKPEQGHFAFSRTGTEES